MLIILHYYVEINIVQVCFLSENSFYISQYEGALYPNRLESEKPPKYNPATYGTDYQVNFPTQAPQIMTQHKKPQMGN